MLRLFDLVGHHCPSPGSKPVCKECRTTCRYPAVENDARLGWWLGTDFHEVAARLEDISQGGVSMLSEETPPTDEVYVRLASPSATEWAMMCVCRTTSTAEGECHLGARFSEGCPYELFKNTKGCHLDETSENASPEFDGRYWR